MKLLNQKIISLLKSYTISGHTGYIFFGHTYHAVETEGKYLDRISTID